MREPIEWNMWSLDKSYRIFSCKLALIDEASKDVELQEKMRDDIKNRIEKFCAHTTI